MMKYIKEKNKIVIKENSEFNPEHILECGQVFRFKKIENGYVVYSLDKTATITEKNNNYEILTNDIDYFENYFDLKNDYGVIKNKILKLSHNGDFMKNAISFGEGIRILKQNNFEASFCFVISQNNNIKRIQLIVERICEKYGTNMGSYFAFPTIKQLKNVTEQEYKDLGAGYRSSFLVNIVKYFDELDTNIFLTLSFAEQEKMLLSIKGVGQKVCDCIMLFGYHQMKVFPVDTWIEKVYKDYFFDDKILIDRIKIRQKLVSIFGDYSGYAQQYLFYYKRNDPNS